MNKRAFAFDFARLGGLGPLWAIADTEGVPALAAKPLAQRLAACPWAWYHVEVQG